MIWSPARRLVHEPGFAIWTDCRPHDGVHGAARPRRSTRQHVPIRQGQSFGQPLRSVPPSFPRLVTPTVAFKDTPAESPLTIAFTPLGSRSRRVPCESLDAPENLPKEAPCQGALGKLQDEVPGMSDEAPVLNSRCWRLVRDQLWMETGRTSRRSEVRHEQKRALFRRRSFISSPPVPASSG